VFFDIQIKVIPKSSVNKKYIKMKKELARKSHNKNNKKRD
jgi:hypothetical protein